MQLIKSKNTHSRKSEQKWTVRKLFQNMQNLAHMFYMIFKMKVLFFSTSGLENIMPGDNKTNFLKFEKWKL